eukprot:TRINITY_DN75450_c0_g1_i1.p1 TRINITY_DN75450_c0_g1~~TRINITY_DN75450_c0_g1_i1.p1  ORF type:complete len:529 (-),score=57.04 TRINITY_DN75450_c0_g1_i1:123-1502(-)
MRGDNRSSGGGVNSMSGDQERKERSSANLRAGFGQMFQPERPDSRKNEDRTNMDEGGHYPGPMFMGQPSMGRGVDPLSPGMLQQAHSPFGRSDPRPPANTPTSNLSSASTTPTQRNAPLRNKLPSKKWTEKAAEQPFMQHRGPHPQQQPPPKYNVESHGHQQQQPNKGHHDNSYPQPGGQAAFQDLQSMIGGTVRHNHQGDAQAPQTAVPQQGSRSLNAPPQHRQGSNEPSVGSHANLPPRAGPPDHVNNSTGGGGMHHHHHQYGGGGGNTHNYHQQQHHPPPRGGSGPHSSSSRYQPRYAQDKGDDDSGYHNNHHSNSNYHHPHNGNHYNSGGGGHYHNSGHGNHGGYGHHNEGYQSGGGSKWVPKQGNQPSSGRDAGPNDDYPQHSHQHHGKGGDQRQQQDYDPMYSNSNNGWDDSYHHGGGGYRGRGKGGPGFYTRGAYHGGNGMRHGYGRRGDNR